MIRRILFPTDFSKACEIGLNAVKKLKDIGAEEIMLFHVIDLNKLIGPASGIDIPAILHNYEKESLENLEKVAENLKEFKVKIIQPKIGDPVSLICDVADEENADVIAIPSSGKGLLFEFLLGSVSEGVVEKSKKPVFVIKFDINKEPTFDNLFDRILYCYDFSEQAGKLKYFVELFAKKGGKVTIIHVVEKGKKLEDKDIERLEIIKENFDNANIIIEEGTPYKEIIRVAEENKATLIAIANSEKRHILGGTSHNVIRKAKIPVFVYK